MFSTLARMFFAVLPLAALGACATVPRTDTSLSGAVPAGRVYALVDGTRYFGTSELPLARLEQCLSAAGLSRGSSADVLVQVSHAVRPAKARVLAAGDASAAPRHLRSERDREELVLVLTDPASGAVILRAAAARTLRKGEAPGNGADLAGTVCGLIPARAGAAAGAASR